MPTASHPGLASLGVKEKGEYSKYVE